MDSFKVTEKMIEKYEPAYITIVEGPPPDFSNVSNEWAYSMLEGLRNNNIALCEMRTFSGPKMVKRCQEAWREGRPARLDFPTGEGARGQLDIVAVRWEKVEEGHKLYLWVKI
jgi:hypothetical protein